MLAKLRVVTILLVVVLIGAGPLAALDGARDEGAPAVLAWVVQPLAMLWYWVPDSLLDAVSGSNGDPVEAGQLNEENAQDPPLEEAHFLIEPEG